MQNLRRPGAYSIHLACKELSVTASPPPRDCRKGLIRRLVHESRLLHGGSFSPTCSRGHQGVTGAVHVPWTVGYGAGGTEGQTESGARLNGFRKPVCSPRARVLSTKTRAANQPTHATLGKTERRWCCEATNGHSIRARARGAFVSRQTRI